MSLLRPLLPLAAFVLAATPLAAQTVRGKVLDAATGAGVPEAAVRALTPDGHDVGRARTAADGSFRMQLRTSATVRVEARRTGYQQTLTAELPVALHEAVEVEVRISATALALEPLRVTARVAPPRRRSLELNGVYDRERMGLGRRLFREDIERRPNLDLGGLLQGVVGTRMVYAGRYKYIVFNRSSISAAMTGGPPCLPRLYLDGVRVEYGGSFDINSFVLPERVEAVELYASAAEIPPQYNGMNSACGVILIWTRTEP